MSSLHGRRVLLVEDEPLIAMMAEDMLAALGAVVVGPASTLAEALQLARSAEFDIALLDVNLRNERIDPVVALIQERRLPLVLATGYGRTKSDLPAGVIVIEKPYTEDRLLRVLSSNPL
jgi:CheY-like chemotaxis protein